jgi:beta-ureidopropionase / N-carbamoyl-L-amino-acid hydrolase
MKNRLTSQFRVNSHRLKVDFDDLAKIGLSDKGRITRPAFSPAYQAARAWFQEKISLAEFGFLVDGAGNHSAFLECGSTDSSRLLIGSHLDSLPDSDCHEGSFGVISALEILRLVKEAGIHIDFNLEAIDLTDKKGALISQLGSKALAGKLTVHDLDHPRGGRKKFLDSFAKVGLTEEGIFGAKREPGKVAGYLELQIEQTGRLIDANADIGIVENITGIGSYIFKFIGHSGYSPTTSTQDRVDPSQGASSFILAVYRLIENSFSDCVVNIGNVELSPDRLDLVPYHVSVSLEARALDLPTFDRFESALIELSQMEAANFGLTLEVEILEKLPPASTSKMIQNAITESAESLGLKSISLSTMAGQNAQSLVELCPVGVILVPIMNSERESRSESINWTNCINGANVLLQTVLRLCFSL